LTVKSTTVGATDLSCVVSFILNVFPQNNSFSCSFDVLLCDIPTEHEKCKL